MGTSIPGEITMMRRRPIAEPVLRDLAERATAAGVSRRSFLGLLGAVGGGAALSACGDDRDTVARQSVRWGSWPLYLDVDDDGTYPT
ncbi:MAG: twin-arginine translocation signal domain-containing protein, partial [Micrococcales bacterium]|nr:twin-arginine translocation signal domain-containing protein [Micrococcales bacterium]